MKKKSLLVLTLTALTALPLTSCGLFIDIYSPTAISLDSEITLEGGESQKLTYKLSPTTAKIDSYTWSVEDQNIAYVNDGIVTGLSKGTTNVSLTVKYRSTTLSTSCVVNVTSEYVSSKTELSYTYNDYVDENVYAISNTPTIGSPKLLIIPIWFTNSDNYVKSSYRNTVKEDIRLAYFGSNEETGWRSVKTYYSELSKEKLQLSGTVSSWYECGNKSSYYSSSSLTSELVSEATDWYFKNNTSDKRSNYDYDNDGYLDGVMLIYAAPDYSVTKSTNTNLWAYCHWIQGRNPNKLSPNPNVYFWASFDFMYGSNVVASKTGKNYAGGDTTYCNLDTHTYIHEMGHVLGFTDYYDTSDTSKYEAYTPAGGFTMQDYNVGSHDPYSVLAAGWATPYIPLKSVTINLKPFQTSNEMIILTPEWNSSNSPFDEYIIIEYYTPDGLNEFDTKNAYKQKYPTGSSKSGIRVWHVDARLTHYISSSSSYSTQLTSDPTVGLVYHAMSNTSHDGDHVSPLGESYYSFNLLQLIRNDKKETYRMSDFFSDESLFYAGDTFKMETYSSQFVKRSKLNSGKSLGWSFSVAALTDESATITLTKAN